ncbi:MAG: hypothetical protein ACE5KO_03440, partial [Candidatus Bathyarchaeia archaeon]
MSKEELGIPEGKGSGFKDKYLSPWKIWLILGIITAGVISAGPIFLMRLMNVMGLSQFGVLYMGTPLPFQLVGDLANAAVQPLAIQAIFFDHIWMQFYLLGFSLLKAGIGGALYVAIKKQRATRNAALRAAGYTGSLPKEPFFAKAAPWLLVAGTDVQIINFFGFSSWWAVNGTNMLNLQFAGLANTPEFLSALLVERSLFLATLTGEFAGASLALMGVALLVATFVMFAKAEGSWLPQVLSRLGKGASALT